MNTRHIIAIIGYWSGLDTLFYWLNRKAKRTLTFHNVLPDEVKSQGPNIGITDSLSNFKKMIGWIRERFRFSTDLSDPNTVTITFDDGTLNEYEIAGKYLMAQNIPAILFMVGDIVGAEPKNGIMLDLLSLWTSTTPKEVVEQVFGENKTDKSMWQGVVKPAFFADNENRGKMVFDKAMAVYSMEKAFKALSQEWLRLRMGGISEEQLQDLKNHGWKIGWHTWSHFPLGMLNDKQRREELDAPSEYRKEVLSYPYGMIGAVGESTLKIAKEMAYPGAVSNDPDYSPYRGRFFQMRFAPRYNKYDVHFLLSGLKYFLQTGKLLPKV